MSPSPIDPAGHAHPLRLSTLSSALLLDRKPRQVVVVATAIVGLLFGLLALLVSMAAYQSFKPWMILFSLVASILYSLMAWVGFVKIYEWMDHHYHPNEFRLAKDTRGLDLLRDGEELVRRRERLDCDQKSDHPLMSPAEALYAWKEQGRLERNLHAQQDALLRELGTT